MHLNTMLTQRLSSRFVRATRYDRKPGEVLDWHEHRDLSFCFVVKGDYGETTRRQTFTCRPGDVIVKPPNVRHLNVFGQTGAVCLLLEISDEIFSSSIGLFEPELQGLVRNQSLTRIGLELCEELQLADSLAPIALEGFALRSLASVLRLERAKSIRHKQVEAIRELLDAGARTEEVTQRDFSSKEKKILRGLFHKTQGCSIETYALRRRAFRAYDELLNTDHSIAEIAVGCGFYDQAHLTHVFTKLFGVTPGRLRSQIH